MKGARGNRHRLKMARKAAQRHAAFVRELGLRYTIMKRVFATAMDVIKAQAAIINAKDTPRPAEDDLPKDQP